MNLIGIAGQKRSGKDTAADYIAKEYGFEKRSFAAKLKSIFKGLYGVDDEFIDYWKTQPEPPPGFKKPFRDCLVQIGNSFRELDPFTWVNYCIENIGSDAVISDVRFENEIDAINKAGGVNILIYRPGFLNQDPAESYLYNLIQHYKTNTLEGEQAQIPYMPPINHFIINDGTEKDLYRKIDTVFRSEFANSCKIE